MRPPLVSAVCRIRVDPAERAGGVPERLARRGAHIEIVRLAAGDYALPGGALIERKTVLDLHLSLERARFWRQIGALRKASSRAFLVVEGDRLEAGPIALTAIRSVLLSVLQQGVPILWSADQADTAEWVIQVARWSGRPRLARDRPVYAQKRKPNVDQVGEAMLAAVPRISVATARKLLRAFGNVRSVVNAGPAAWADVPGIGKMRAAALEKAVSSHSGREA